VRRLKDYNEDYLADKVGNMTPLGIAARFVGFILVLVVLFAVIGFIGGWFNTAKDVVSPKNVKNQYQFAYTYNEALKGIAQNVCNYQKAYDSETDLAIKSQRQTQLLAEESLYQQRQREYDAQLENAFQAKYVKPADVPTKAPTLSNEIAAVC
jgi:cell shape-determining protein MreC